MGPDTLPLEPILSAYPAALRPIGVEYLDSAGGFSGARLWRLRAREAQLCLRRWPSEHPGRERLEFIHRVLRHVRSAGCSLVGVPFSTCEGASYVESQGHLWELTPWLPGTADYRQQPSDAKLRGALAALAEFHRAAQDFRLPTENQPKRLAPSPGIQSRHAQLEGLLLGKFSDLTMAVLRHDCSTTGAPARRILDFFPTAADFVLRRLSAARAIVVPLEPVIRDIWREHVLFEEAKVSGIIDFGAMRCDTVAADVARLLGSMVADDAGGWRKGLEAYESIRPLSGDERQLVEVFDQSTVLMSGTNWLQWIYLEHRDFRDLDAVASKLDEIAARLEHLSQSIHSRPFGD